MGRTCGIVRSQAGSEELLVIIQAYRLNFADYLCRSGHVNGRKICKNISKVLGSSNSKIRVPSSGLFVGENYLGRELENDLQVQYT
jgi:hypothetical protein